MALGNTSWLALDALLEPRSKLAACAQCRGKSHCCEVSARCSLTVKLCLTQNRSRCAQLCVPDQAFRPCTASPRASVYIRAHKSLVTRPRMAFSLEREVQKVIPAPAESWGKGPAEVGRLGFGRSPPRSAQPPTALQQKTRRWFMCLRFCHL